MNSFLTEKSNKIGKNELLITSGKYCKVGTTLKLTKSYKNFREIVVYTGWDGNSTTAIPSGVEYHTLPSSLIVINRGFLIPCHAHGKLDGVINIKFTDETTIVIAASTYTGDGTTGIREIHGIY